MGFLAPHAERIYALFRIMAGLLFLEHGTQKLFNFPPAPQPMELSALIGTAGAIEFLGGLLVAVGLLAGVAAFISSGTMAVAYFMVHAPRGLFPIDDRAGGNGGELAILYCFAFLFIAAKGSGIWSVDAARSAK